MPACQRAFVVFRSAQFRISEDGNRTKPPQAQRTKSPCTLLPHRRHGEAFAQAAQRNRTHGPQGARGEGAEDPPASSRCRSGGQTPGPGGRATSIECAFFGFLAADAESRTSQAGKQWVRLRVGVGKDDAMQWISVAVFGKAAETAAELKKGDRCYCEGTIKIDSWRGGDGAEKHGLSVSSFKIEKTHEIGRNRPRSEKPRNEKPAPAASGRERAARSDYVPIGRTDADLNDDIPF